jgi:DHA2 family methylenomycin A resistance protein-like MFS transporter
MSPSRAASRPPAEDSGTLSRGSANAALAASVLGFFVITLDALVVNVALPDIHKDLGGGITGLQWVVDGYTLLFAALLLSAGSLGDRIGAHRAFGLGMAVFVLASAGCGLAPGLGVLISARMLQGTGAALMMPSSLTLIREAFPDQVERGRAIALWTIGGSVAAAAGPVVGGALSLISWRAIFFINLPVGVIALLFLARAHRSPRRAVPFDLVGQIAAVAAMGGLTYGVIEAGADGFASPKALAALTIALAVAVVFGVAQARGRHPMAPLDLLRTRTMVVSAGTGFAFIAGLTGAVFTYGLYLQQARGLSPFAAGLVFLPMTALSGFVSMPAARLARTFGPRVPIVCGMLLMATGFVILAALPATAPVWLLAIVLIPVGINGPLSMQPTTGVLLSSVPAHRAGVASGVFNTSRQIGGALAVAVFGALISSGHAGFQDGLRASMLIAAVVALAAAAANVQTKPAPAPVPATSGS